MKIGINGFGRIGTTIARVLWESKKHELVAINDHFGNCKNFPYRLKYDSVYGRFNGSVNLNSRDTLLINGSKQWKVALRNSEDWPDDFWKKNRCKVVFDCSGRQNWDEFGCSKKKEKDYKIIITEPSDRAEICAVSGLQFNAGLLNKAHVISGSSCDGNALAPLLYAIHRSHFVVQCNIATLHPWLGHQRITDGFISDGSINSELPESLGRAAPGCVIPKETSVGRVLINLLPELKGKIHAFSFRVPTASVTYAIAYFSVKQLENRNSLIDTLRGVSDVFISRDKCVSTDYLGLRSAVVVEEPNLVLTGDRGFRIVIAYDNEWGYCSQIIKILDYIR